MQGVDSRIFETLWDDILALQVGSGTCIFIQGSLTRFTGGLRDKTADVERKKERV
jgi:hypothetical protein